MALVVKVMSGEESHDDSPAKAHRLYTGVTYVEFDRDENGHPEAFLFYEESHREAESLRPDGNVYVMNDNGRTISRFEYEPAVDWKARQEAQDDRRTPKERVRGDG